MSSCHLSGLPDQLHAGSLPATRRSTSTRRSCRTSSASGTQRLRTTAARPAPGPQVYRAASSPRRDPDPQASLVSPMGRWAAARRRERTGRKIATALATILRRTTTNQADRRPFGFSIQQRLRFAWAVRVILGLDEALRRLTAGRRPELAEKADGRRATVRSTPGHGRESSAVTRGRALWRS
jgi:hypothetical protein